MEIRDLLTEALNGLQRARGIAPEGGLALSALRWELYAALQNTLDALAMIIADVGLRKPLSYAELGRALSEAGLLEEHHADVVRAVASTRKTLAHAYRGLTAEDLSGVLKAIVPGVEKLIGRLLELLNRKGVDPPRENTLVAGNLGGIFAEHGVRVAYLFGSRARGTARAESDYDMAALFESSDVTLPDEVGLAKDLAKALGVPADRVDVVALNRAGGELVARVFKEGVSIYSSSDVERRRWECSAYVDLLRRRDLDAVYVTRTMPRVPRSGGRESSAGGARTLSPSCRP